MQIYSCIKRGQSLHTINIHGSASLTIYPSSPAGCNLDIVIVSVFLRDVYLQKVLNFSVHDNVSRGDIHADLRKNYIVMN